MIYNKEQYRNASNINWRIAMHENYSVNPQGFHEWVFDQMDIRENSKILECGCGPGALWYKNAEKIINMNLDIILVDMSKGMLEDAKKNIGAVDGVSFEFVQADIQNLPFDDAKFDIVIANHMMYHVPDINKGIKEVYRVLKKDGLFYTSTFSKNHMHELNELTAKYVELPKSRVSDRYTLENGKEYVYEVFNNVETRMHEDSLKIDNPDAVIKYIFSGSHAKQQLIGEKKDIFEKNIKSMFNEEKIFNVKKEAGVMIARKTENIIA